MALYTQAQYRSGAEGYLTVKAQTGALVPSYAVADPSAQTEVNGLWGFCDLPSRDRDEGRQPVEAIGSMRVATHTNGARVYQCGISRVLVADGTYLLYAVRNHADPDQVGTVRGLRLLTAEYGTTSEYGAQIAWAEQAVDTLINSLRLNYQEGQPVQAGLDLWPMVVLASGVTPKETIGQQAAAVLHWTNLEWTVGGTDYRPILASTGITLSNNGRRDGVRNQMGAEGSELAISRTPYAIVPTVETLQIQHRFRDKLPAALSGTANWGELVVRAEQPGVGAGRNYFQAALAYNFVMRETGEAANARAPQMWSTTVLGYEVELTAGTT